MSVTITITLADVDRERLADVFLELGGSVSALPPIELAALAALRVGLDAAQHSRVYRNAIRALAG